MKDVRPKVIFFKKKHQTGKNINEMMKKLYKKFYKFAGVLMCAIFCTIL